eukprot:10539979-Alexandrium_andersonii.AAC.1
MYATGWAWPRHSRGKSATGVDALSTKRSNSSWRKGAFGAAASEGLSLFPAMAYFVRTVVAPGGASCSSPLIPEPLSR